MADKIPRSFLISSVIIAYFITLTGCQTCINNPDVNQRGDVTVSRGRQVIVPSATFNCNGRITNVAISMQFSFSGSDLPLFQLWRLASPNSGIYSKVGEVELPPGDRIGGFIINYYFANLSLSSEIEFQSGDVIGYYQPPEAQRVIRSIQTSGYTSYSSTVTSPSISIDISSVGNIERDRQPLIEVTFDIQCDNLSTPANGEITSCSSGRVGVGYEGDTCSFTCNTGYELTGSDARTCQSDGSWIGTVVACRRVLCPLPANPNNGTSNCSLGDNGVLSYEDTCSFTCNTGYELTGSDTRTCQSNGIWSGSEAVCRRVTCSSLTNPNNGVISCSLGGDNVSLYEDTCSFTCNTGYELTGSDTRTCQSNGSWSGSGDVCRRVICPSLLGTNGRDDVNCSLGDDGVPSYGDICSINCAAGYELTDNDTRICQSNGKWSGVDNVCRKIACSLLEDLTNGVTSCQSENNGVSSFEDNCSFTCNTGYELTGSDTRTCQSDGSWSGSDAMCRRVSCSMLTNSSSGMINCSLGDDGVPSYEDTCSFTCNTGYELTGSDTRTCQSDGNWSGSDAVCRRVICPSLSGTNGRDDVNCSLGDDWVPSYGDICNINCAAGYELTGNDTRICQSNGKWSGIDNVCRKMVVCSLLEDLTNGVTSCQSGKYGVSSYEDTCSFTCNTGYELTGSSERTCQSDGSWSGDSAYCVKGPSKTTIITETSSLLVPSASVDNDNPTSSDSPSGKAGLIGGIVAVAIVFILLAITAFIILMLIYCNRCKDLKKSTGHVCVNSSTFAHEMDYNLYSTVCERGKPTPLTRESVITITDIEELRDVHTHQIPNTSTMELPDYEPVPRLSGYEMLDCVNNQLQEYREYSYLENISGGPEPYHQPLSSTNPPVVAIYQDPGHSKEVIYEWFNKMKCRKIHSSDVTTLQILGSGNFGVVRLGLWSNGSTDPVQVAVKTLNSQCSESDRVKFLREAAIMGQFVHNNVVQLHGVVTEEENMMIVLDYMPKGDLRGYLKDIKLNNEYKNLSSKLLNFCRQIAAGMNYLANKQFVHRDLAARNILVSSDDMCKIADFGMARDVADDTYYITTDGKIPVKWTAPEALFYHKYSTMSDIWSYGCVLYEIWSLGHRPFEDVVASKAIELLSTGYRLPPPPGCSKLLYNLMIDCWNVRPKDRPRFCVIVKILCAKDEEIFCEAQDEVLTNLGDTLTASFNSYKDLQLTYCNNIIKSTNQ